jgi:hypothetical protein
LLLVCALSGCGEDGQSIGDTGKCPEQPLYHYEFVDAGGKWVPRHADGSDFTAAEQTQLNDAITGATSPSGGQRCLTPPGSAKTLDAGH